MPFSRYPSGSCPCQVSLPFELRHFPAGSLSPLSRIEFVSYRLVVLLRLLPTPPHDDAVAVEYGPENVCPVGTFTLLFKCAYERTGRTLRGPNRFAARRPLPLFAGLSIRLSVGGPPVVRTSVQHCFRSRHEGLSHISRDKAGIATTRADLAARTTASGRTGSGVR